MHPLEAYLAELRDTRLSGGGVKETSYYPALSALLNEAGKASGVRCIINLRNTGAGIPDGGFFTKNQFPSRSADEPEAGQVPERGALEVKGIDDDVLAIAETEQVEKYLARYGQVLVTNLRDFVLVGSDHTGQRRILEVFRIAKSRQAFLKCLANPRATAAERGEPLFEYLKRILVRPVPLADPKDLAWFLASYAKEARTRVEGVDLPALKSLRESLEASLGITFEGERGEHFFRSTLVQTLFYGVFSAWVLWSRRGSEGRFNWHEAAWDLRVPMIRALFHQVADPNRLKRLDLIEVLDWAVEALNRVDRAAFFTRFREEHAVQYFYEPFLEAFDPELRKQLGVWYTPPEVVKYMVAKVDRTLRTELDVPDGLADERVVVLDPCCGTGAYLVEVLHRIEETLREKGEDALVAADVKAAAIKRVFGFDIMPAPFVVAHLQLGLLLQQMEVPFKDHERAGVYLTNALTGWVSPKDPKDQLTISLPELAEERDQAEHVKRDEPILVILGNPPYSGYAGMAIGEERDLTEAYRTTKKAPKPQGQGLNDLYVRFFRMAERKITEMDPRKGVVCFISNYGWLDGLSFTGMRERYMQRFDQIEIDSLNGDKYRTGKVTPEGDPDPSIFSTKQNREGIQVGTAIATLVRKESGDSAVKVQFRDLWGSEKARRLEEEAGRLGALEYTPLTPAVELGFPFRQQLVRDEYLKWPSLPELFPVFSPGIITARDDLVVDIDQERLVARMNRYFDPSIDLAELAKDAPSAATETKRFDPTAVRQHLLRRGLKEYRFVPYVYRPMDLRWLYWEPETKLVEEKRSEFFPHTQIQNVWLSASQRHRRGFSPPTISTDVGAFHMFERATSLFPLYIAPTAHPKSLFEVDENTVQPNLTRLAVECVESLGSIEDAPHLFYHAIAMMHTPAYREENSGALRQDWPRIPLPDNREELVASAEIGRRLAALLNPAISVSGVTSGSIRPELRIIGSAAKVGGGPLGGNEGDLEVTARWGYAGRGGATMPGRGKAVERPFTEEERDALAQVDLAALELLGESCYDVYLNDTAYWRCVPARVWEYRLGGYQVMKKWLSYREKNLLGRPLRLEEVREVTSMARRIAAILLLQPALDDVYRALSTPGVMEQDQVLA